MGDGSLIAETNMAYGRTRLLLALGTIGVLASCGGGGSSSPTVPMLKASGVVALPAGFASGAGGLTVAAAGGPASVGAGDAFTVSEPAGGGPATILLTQSDGKVVLLGHVDTDDPSFNELSVTSTAEELLFVSTGSTTLPTSEWSNVYKLLAAAPETATLAGVIGARMAVSSTAVGDMDPDIATAVANATASLWQTTLQATRAAMRRAPGGAIQGSAGITVTRASTTASDGGTILSVLVDPDSATPTPNGIGVQPSLDKLGITIENDMRIHRKYFVFRTGYVPSTGKVTDDPQPFDPDVWVEVASGYLPAETGVTGVVSAFIDYFVGGKVAYAPVCVNGKAPPCPTVVLPIDPPDAKANTFQVYVVGAGGNLGLAGVPAPLAKQPAAAAEVQTELVKMELLEGFKELLWPILTKALPAKISDAIWKSPDEATTIILQFVKEGGTAAANWAAAMEKGNYLPSLTDAAKALTSNKQFRDAAYNAVLDLAYRQAKAIDAHAVDNLASYWQSVDNILPVMKVLDQVATVTDTACVFVQIANSYDYSVWDVRAFPPVFTLVPPSATIGSASQTAKFSVTPTGYSSSALKYQWGPSTYGTFTTSCGTGVTVSCPGDQTATYSLIGTSLPKMPSDTFPVQVFDPDGKSLGVATGVVNFQTVVINPPNPTVLEGAHQTFTAAFTTGPVPAGTSVTWTLTGSGTLNGGTSPVTSTSLTVDYLAPMASETDTLAVQLTDASRNSLGGTSTQIAVVPALTITPDVPLPLGAQQVYTVSGANGFVLPAGASYRWTVIGNGSVSGGSSTTTTSPSVTYAAPSASSRDTLQVQVIGAGGVVVARTSLVIYVGVIVWTGTCYDVTNASSFPIYATSQVTLNEYVVDPTHVYFIGESSDNQGSTYRMTCGSAAAPAAVTGSEGAQFIALPGCALDNTNGPLCTTTMPAMTVEQTATELYVPECSYTWSDACSNATTDASPCTFTKN